MGIVDDVLKALNSIPAWRKVAEVPARADAIEARLAAIEAKLDNKWVPDVCRHCGERAMRLNRTTGPNGAGLTTEIWGCTACDFHENRAIQPIRR